MVIAPWLDRLPCCSPDKVIQHCREEKTDEHQAAMVISIAAALMAGASMLAAGLPLAVTNADLK